MLRQLGLLRSLIVGARSFRALMAASQPHRRQPAQNRSA
jgi:hypothetical protein